MKVLPYLIAEIGLNHGGDYQTAARMIHEAARAGANACKFQFVKADRLVSRVAPTYFEQVGTAAQSQHEFFARSDALGRPEYEELANVCHDYGVDFLCTPFDVETVEWLNPLVPAFKIASADITNIPLLEEIAARKKLVYLSTGAATPDEIDTAVWTLYNGGPGVIRGANTAAPCVYRMHCVLSYPTAPQDANLGMIGKGSWWGYSDHTLFNLDVLTTAWLLGATVIEKHFTLDKTLPGNDHYHSMDPTDLRVLVAKFKELQLIIGDGEKRVLPCEEAARLNARQSWHAARFLPAGYELTARDIVLKRPADGYAPATNLVGYTMRETVHEDEPLTEANCGAATVQPAHG